MALATAVFFYHEHPCAALGWSIVLALGSALGTQVWSTASRVMWSDTWAIVLTAVIIFLLLASRLDADGPGYLLDAGNVIGVELFRSSH